TSSWTNLSLGREKRALARSTFVRLPSMPSTSAPLDANSAEKSPSREARSRIRDSESGLLEKSLTIWLMRALRLIRYASHPHPLVNSRAESIPPPPRAATLPHHAREPERDDGEGDEEGEADDVRPHEGQHAAEDGRRAHLGDEGAEHEHVHAHGRADEAD